MLLKWKTGEFTTTNLTTHAVKNLNCECVCFFSIDSSAGIVCWWREFWTPAWCLFMSWTMVSTSWSAAHSSDLWSKSSGSCRFRESLLSWLVSTRHMTLSQLGCTITSICKTYYLFIPIYLCLVLIWTWLLVLRRSEAKAVVRGGLHCFPAPRGEEAYGGPAGGRTGSH